MSVDANEERVSICLGPVVIHVAVPEDPVRVDIPAHVLRVVIDVELQQSPQHVLVAERDGLNLNLHECKTARWPVRSASAYRQICVQVFSSASRNRRATRVGKA